MNEFNRNGAELRDSVQKAIDNFKIAFFPLESKNINKTNGGCYIQDPNTGKSKISMTKIDNNLHTEESCKLNAGIKQSKHINSQLNKPNEGNQSVYYSLVERNTVSTSKGYYDCYVTDMISNQIEESTDDMKEVTIWKAFNENEKHLIKPGNYAYYRNGALFICDKNGNVLKQLGDTIDESSYDNPNSYYILKSNEKNCYGSRYNDI